MKQQPERRGLDLRIEPAKPFNVPGQPFRESVPTEFEILKDALVRDAIRFLADRRFNSALRRAANEAAALVWTTPFPSLLFPELFREKVTEAYAQVAKQESILRRSRALVALAL